MSLNRNRRPDRRGTTAGRRTVAAALAVLALPTVAGAEDASAAGEGGAHAGILECHTVAGSGYTVLIHSSVEIVCLLRRDHGVEHYRGEMGIALGLDLNWRQRETVRFGVVGIARDPTLGAHALAGRYAGGKASLALRYGLGAEALIGGGRNGFALQPLGISTSEGYGVAAGLAYLVLRPAPEPSRAASPSPRTPPPPSPRPPS